MKTIVFDVMCDGRFVMQHRHQWCSLIPVDLGKVTEEVLLRRPTLKGKHIELFETKNVVR